MVHTTVRKAKKSDLPAIESLTKEVMKTIANQKGIDIQHAVDKCKMLINDPHACFFVAELNKTIVGFINVTIRKTILHQGLSGLIDELIITKEFRGKGIGNQLVLAAISKCRQLGCCECEVSTEKTNTKAREFYQKCGFEERGLLFELDL
jgi:ribosomal protein S18 acetylase RimI-like enzyme